MPKGQPGTQVLTEKKRKTRYGVTIKNPLSLPVKVIITSGTGALYTGSRYSTERIIKPGQSVFIPMKGTAEVKIDTVIIRYDEKGDPVELGTAGWRKTGHRAGDGAPEYVTEEKPKKEPVKEEPIRSLGEMIEDMRKREEVKV